MPVPIKAMACYRSMMAAPWYQIKYANNTSSEEILDNVVRLEAVEFLKKAETQEGVRIFSNGVKGFARRIYFSPEAAEILSSPKAAKDLKPEWLKSYGAEVCGEPCESTLVPIYP